MKEINNEDVTKIVNNEIKNFITSSLDNEMKKYIGKSSSETRKELVVLIKNSLESVYKLLWQKRDFWKNDIK